MRTLQILLAPVVLAVPLLAGGPAAAAEPPTTNALYCVFTDGVYYAGRQIIAPTQVCLPGP